jgi:hypothetical protein
MAENERADRPDDNAEAVDGNRRSRRREPRQLEEDAAPHRRCDHACDQEVVLLDHRADDARECDP